MQSKEFDSQIQRLTGDCAVASAFVSYLGPFNKEFRELLMTRDFYGDCIKLNIPVTQNIEVGCSRAHDGCACSCVYSCTQRSAEHQPGNVTPLQPAIANLPCDLQVSKFLVDDSEVGEWVLQGLPTDELSVQNGIMVTRASR